MNKGIGDQRKIHLLNCHRFMDGIALMLCLKRQQLMFYAKSVLLFVASLLISAGSAWAYESQYSPLEYYESAGWVTQKASPPEVCSAYADLWAWNVNGYSMQLLQESAGTWRCQRYYNGQLEPGWSVLIYGACQTASATPLSTLTGKYVSHPSYDKTTGICSCPGGMFKRDIQWCIPKCGPGKANAPDTFGCVQVMDRYRDKPAKDTCVGNPIHPLTGAKTLTQSLNEKPLGSFESLTLHYDTRRKLPGTPDLAVQPPPAFGALWSSSVHKKLLVQIDGQGIRHAVQVWRGNRWVSFTRSSTGSYVPDADVQDSLTHTGSGWRYVDAARLTQETYDTAGRLLSVFHVRGAQLTYTYSTVDTPASIAPVPGLLIKVQDHHGRSVQFQYEQPVGVDAPRIRQITGPSGQSAGVLYDGNGNLSQINWPDSNNRQYLYQRADLVWAMTGLTDELGKRFATYDYDSRGRAISTEHAGGVDRYSVSYGTVPSWQINESFDSTNRIVWREHTWIAPSATSITRPDGISISWSASLVQGTPRLSTSSQPPGSGCDASTSTQAYDANGNVSMREDFNGHRACYAYDLNRNLQTGSVEGLSNTAVCSTVLSSGSLPPGSRKTSTQWHPQWALPVVVTEPLKKTTYVYNGQPDPFNAGATASCAPGAPALPDGSSVAVLCKKVEQATTDANGSQDFAAAPDPAVAARTWRYDYNQYGQLLTETDPASHVTTYSYYSVDGADYRKGDLKSVQPPLIPATQYPKYNAAGQVLQSVDPSGVATSYEYDLRQRLLSSTVVTASGNLKTSYEWHPTGLLKKAIQPNGSFVEYFYDDAHRLTSVKDQLGNTISYAYDAMGNRKAETVKDSGNALARQVARTFDALSRLQRLSPGANQ